MKDSEIELTILMPCLNEAETLALCISKAKHFASLNRVSAEILIADNGSSDGSQEIARTAGARLVEVQTRGYGAALKAGIKAAHGQYIIMGDADDSYDFESLSPFLHRLRSGDDLVMGNRFLGVIKPGAMPVLHRYLGNPMLTGVGRLFFKSPCGDFHCGLRGFRKKSIVDIKLQTDGMEFASEMVVKATLGKLKISEVPTNLSPDGRTRPPHLRSWRDGWRHLRFLLIFSPRWLFFIPGIGMMLTGSILMAWVLPRSRSVFGVELDVHTLAIGSGLFIVGLQALIFALYTKVLGSQLGLLPTDRNFQKYINEASLEKGLVVGLVLLGLGVAGIIYAFMFWKSTAYGPQNPAELMRIVIPATTALSAGTLIMFSSFFLSILKLSKPKSE